MVFPLLNLLKERRYMKIIIGSDDAAIELKERLIKYIENKGHEIVDVEFDSNKNTFYADVAEKLSHQIADGNANRGILLCGTGIGMAITANKIPGIRAAVSHDIYSLERMIKSNNCQVLCMGARIIAPESAEILVDRWLDIEFIDGPSTPKVKRIMEIEKMNRRNICKE